MVRKNTDKTKKPKPKTTTKQKPNQTQTQRIVVNIHKPALSRRSSIKTNRPQQAVSQPTIFQPVIKYSAMTLPYTQPVSQATPVSQALPVTQAVPVVGVPNEPSDFYKTSKRRYEEPKKDEFIFSRPFEPVDISLGRRSEELFGYTMPQPSENIKVAKQRKPSQKTPFSGSNVTQEGINKLFNVAPPTQTATFSVETPSENVAYPATSTFETEPFLEETTPVKYRKPRMPQKMYEEDLNRRYNEAFGKPYSGPPIKNDEFKKMIEKKERENRSK